MGSYITTVFKNIWETDDPLFIDVLEIFKRIKDGNSSGTIEKVRTLKDKKERDNVKKRLPSICFSGRFGKREEKYLLEHSGLICLDIDEVRADDLSKIKEVICEDIFVYGCFISPSGNGLKVIVKITDDKSNHKGQFLALEEYFNKTLSKWQSTKKNEKIKNGVTEKIDPKQGDVLKVHIDKSGKDVNRVCYESYDSNLYYNEDSEIWAEVLDIVIETKPINNSNEVIKNLQTWIDKQESYYKGNRNRYIYKFASAMCRYGVSELEALDYISQRCSDYPAPEIRTTVKGAYKANDFGVEEFNKNSRGQQISTVNIKSNKDVTSFWSINDKGRVVIDPRQFLEFVETQGFGIYRQHPQDKNWQFVFVHNMIVDIVTVVDIKHSVLRYVEKHAPEPVYRELQMKNRYFENTFLNALSLINVEQIRDKPNSSYIFFENFYYEVSSDKIVKKSYIELEGRHIWRNQICKKSITKIVDHKKHDFTQFVFNAMGKNPDKYKSACAAIGYGIHTYKKKRLAKLIYTCDQGSAELDGMAEGGTGKNLFLDCLDFVRSVAKVDGKDFDKRDKFKFQTVAPDTQIISIDDYEGDIKELFTKVTGHFEIEKKSMDKTVLDFELAPKIFLSSNTAPSGFSSSFKRRMHLVEFTDYYNVEYTPSDDFGDRDFFSDDWNQDDYNALYSFLFSCIQYYFKEGLKTTINESEIKFKQLVRNTGRDFAEYWLNQNITELFSAKEIFNQYINITGDDIKIQTFYKNMRKMCALYGWQFVSKGRADVKEIQIIKGNENKKRKPKKA